MGTYGDFMRKRTSERGTGEGTAGWNLESPLNANVTRRQLGSCVAGSAPSSKEREYFCMCKFYACMGMTMKGEMVEGGAMKTMYTGTHACITNMYKKKDACKNDDRDKEKLCEKGVYSEMYTCVNGVYSNFNTKMQGCYKDYVPKKGASCMTAPASSGAAQAMPAVFAVAAATIGHFLN